ncbi:MAG TPA: DUF1801 domain-containing protein [Cyclobacteriaceae bacterium]|nr:DUF1801 domain-containing protein [Cyclobacteriaceae bacterium]
MAKYKAKTFETDKSVDTFLNKVEPETKRDDCYAIVKMMEEASGHPPKMWGPAIVGFGSVHYEYETGHSGDMSLIGFSPRKTNIVLYMGGIVGVHDAQLKKMGKVKTGKVCVYINKLKDLDTKELKDLMKKSVAHVKKTYKVNS